MKKILSLLLALTLLSSLSACKNKDTSSDVSEDISTNQTSSDDETMSTGNANDHETSDTTGSHGKSTGTGKSTDTSNTAGTSKSTETGKSTNASRHTHSFSAATCTEPKKCSCGATEGKALGHKWADATCKAPKTCSVCKITEGNKVDHVVDGTTCKWCKQAIPVSPSHLKQREYRLVKPTKLVLDREVLGVILSSVDFSTKGIDTGTQYVVSDYVADNPPEWFEQRDYVSYNGKKYYGFQGGMGTAFDSQTSNNTIVITTSDLRLELELLSNDTLRVISISGSDSWLRDISVGDIFI